MSPLSTVQARIFWKDQSYKGTHLDQGSFRLRRRTDSQDTGHSLWEVFHSWWSLIVNKPGFLNFRYSLVLNLTIQIVSKWSCRSQCMQLQIIPVSRPQILNCGCKVFIPHLQLGVFVPASRNAKWLRLDSLPKITNQTVCWLRPPQLPVSRLPAAFEADQSYHE